MSERSKRIVLYDEEKLNNINQETQKLMQKYKIDMALRELSPKTQYNYISDLNQWLIYIYDYQFNQSITRHSGAILLKNAGISLEDVSKLLNHLSTDTTSRFYIKEDTTRISKMKDQFEI